MPELWGSQFERRGTGEKRPVTRDNDIIIIIIIIIQLPVLRYCFGNINWYQAELQKLDRKTTKLLTFHGQHHPTADVDRLYVHRKQGGRDLMKLEAAYAVEITTLVEYVDRKKDPLIQVVRTQQHNTDSAVLQTARCMATEVQGETRKMKDSIAEKT